MRRWLLPMLCAVALVLTACGGAGEGTSTTSTTAGQTVRPGVAVGPNIVVSYVQSALTELGYLDQVNGRFDAATADALRRFQRAEQLPADGELDARTALALATKSPATKRYAVLALQTELTELGYYTGLIDGAWGAATKKAVEAVQRQAGIAVDGTVGPATLAALDRQYRQRVVDPDRAADRYFPATTTTAGGAPTTTSTIPAGTTTTHPAATTTTTAAGTTATTATPPSPGGAPTSAQIAEVQGQLAALGYLPGPVTGKPDVQTASAVLAFQKRDGLSRDGQIGPQVLAHLNGPPGAGPRSSAPGPRVEVDLDRQILFFVDAQGHVTTINVSTGSGTTYKEPGGGTAVAYTPTGNFTVLRKIDANEKAPLGSLYRPMYFKGGWAVHGSPSVPAYPASHGCVRVANWNQDFLFPRLPVGAPVWIYGTSLGSPKGAAPGF